MTGLEPRNPRPESGERWTGSSTRTGGAIDIDVPDVNPIDAMHVNTRNPLFSRREIGHGRGIDPQARRKAERRQAERDRDSALGEFPDGRCVLRQWSGMLIDVTEIQHQ